MLIIKPIWPRAELVNTCQCALQWVKSGYPLISSPGRPRLCVSIESPTVLHDDVVCNSSTNICGLPLGL